MTLLTDSACVKIVIHLSLPSHSFPTFNEEKLGKCGNGVYKFFEWFWNVIETIGKENMTWIDSFSVVLVSAIGKDSGKLLQQLFSPLPDLIPMDPKFTGQLSNRLFPFCSLQGHLGFKSTVMGLSHVLNHAIPPSGNGRLTCTLYPCPVSGEHYIPVVTMKTETALRTAYIW